MESLCKPPIRSISAIVLGVVVAAFSVFAGPTGGPVWPVQAQQSVQTPGLAEYVLGPGDSVAITVLGESDLTRTVTIRPDGRITMPLVGDIVAAGQTPTQLAEKLTGALKAYLKNPQVSISVNSFQRAVVYLVGQVSHPGSFEIQKGMTIFEVMAATGGVTPRAAMRRASVIRRGTGQTINVDLEKLLVKGDRSANVELEPGDIIMVPALQNRILVFGRVGRTGAIDLDEGARFLDAMAAAGGPADHAATNNIGVIRNGPDGKPTVKPVDLNKILKGDMSLNIPMQDGDVIFVPAGPLVRWTDVLSWLAGLGVVRTLFTGGG